MEVPMFFVILVNGVVYGVTRYAETAAEEVSFFAHGPLSITVRFVDVAEANHIVRMDEENLYRQELAHAIAL